MKHKNSLWIELCQQLVVIIATIMLFCLLPDFSDGNHFVSRTSSLESPLTMQSENIKSVKSKNKHKKNKLGTIEITERAAALNKLLDLSDENDENDIDEEEIELAEASLQSNQIEKEPITVAAEKLNRVEKINADIEEQAFVLTVQQEQDKLTHEMLNKIESNLITIRKMAQQEGLDSLIDNPGIEEIDKKIALYRRNL